MAFKNLVSKCFHGFKVPSSGSLKRLFLLLFLHVSWQLSAVDVDQWLTDHIQVEDGLPDSTVYSIAQDQTGYMWFGTTHGLARYDGYEFRTFNHDGNNPHSISNNNTGNVFIDSINRLWIGTFGGGLNMLNINTGELTRFPYSNNRTGNMTSENVQTFYEDKAGLIWIGTATGLFSYDGDKFEFHDLSSPNESNSQPRVWDIEGDEAGLIWLGTSGGLIQMNPLNKQFKRLTLPAEMIIDITSNQFRTLHHHNGLLWIGSATGLYSYEPQTGAFEFRSKSQASIKINDIQKITENHLLLASMKGILLYDLAAQGMVFDQHDKLWQQFTHADIRAIHVGFSGVLWLSTRDNGVFKIDMSGGLFDYHDDFLPAAEMNQNTRQIWSVEVGQDGAMFLGTSDSVFRSDNQVDFVQIKSVDSETIPGFIRDMETKDPNGVWIAGSEGLFFLPQDSLSAEPVTTPFDLLGMKPADVFSVELTAQGELWLALYNLGLLRWDPKNNQAELLQSYSGGTLTDVNISHVFEDSKHNLWVGSHLVGLFQIRPQDGLISLHSHRLNDPDSLISNRINDVFEDASGRLWVATARGLSQYLYASNNFKNFTKADGLISNSINAIRADSTGKLWISYRFGLSHFNPDNREIRNYLMNHGIRNDGVITRSATIDHDDKIWLGSANGFYTFKPDAPKDVRHYVPPLVVSNIEIDNQALNSKQLLFENEHVTLAHDNSQVAFNFSVLEYQSPEQIQYQFRIAGLYDEWLNVSQSRRVELKDLNPGNYRLEIQAVNHDGRWREQTKAFSLEVKPVWWEQTWVRVVLACALLFLAMIFHYIRTIKIRKRNLLLEQEVNNRTLELKVLNEQLEVSANSDYLTGLPNRMAFINAFEAKHQNRPADATSSCVVVADVDHFKQINDKYGHNAGDDVLIQLSFIMSNMIRAEDLIARWGGEEFIFYFDGKDIQTTAAFVERIRKAIATTEIKHKNQIIPVTMTFGVCQCLAGMSLDHIVNRADQSMYQGKKAGRNQVVLSPDE